jgi:hypothetical protein
VSLDADRLVTALARLERNLVDQGWPSVRGLQPGLSESDVRERLVDAGFEPPDELIALFGWHDGYVQPDDRLPSSKGGWITPRLGVLSIERALHRYYGVWTALEEIFEEDEVEARWFPVFAGPIGTVVINCGEDAARGSVAVFEPVEGLVGGYRPSSLAEPVEWWANWLESGDYYWGRNINQTPVGMTRLTAEQLDADQLSSGLW